MAALEKSIEAQGFAITPFSETGNGTSTTELYTICNIAAAKFCEIEHDDKTGILRLWRPWKGTKSAQDGIGRLAIVNSCI